MSMKSVCLSFGRVNRFTHRPRRTVFGPKKKQATFFDLLNFTARLRLEDDWISREGAEKISRGLTAFYRVTLAGYALETRTDNETQKERMTDALGIRGTRRARTESDWQLFGVIGRNQLATLSPSEPSPLYW